MVLLSSPFDDGNYSQPSTETYSVPEKPGTATAPQELEMEFPNLFIP